MQKHTHAHTYAHAYTHIHTNTHTYIQTNLKLYSTRVFVPSQKSAANFRQSSFLITVHVLTDESVDSWITPGELRCLHHICLNEIEYN